MHSSRMRKVRCSGHLWGVYEGGVCLGGVRKRKMPAYWGVCLCGCMAGGCTPPDPGGFFTKVMNSLYTPYSLPIRNIWTIKLFRNRKQIWFLNNKSIDLDWYYSKHNWKLKLIIRDLLFTTFVKNPTEADTHPTPYL